MPRITLQKQYLDAYSLSMIVRSIFSPHRSIEESCQQFNVDVDMIVAIMQTRYLNGRHGVAKSGNLHLAWEYAQNPADDHRFVNLLRVTPLVFYTILTLIEDHPVFHNSSNNGQTPVETQFALTLYRMGRSGNGASIEDIARVAGCAEGSVDNFTERCFEAIGSLHDMFVRRLTSAEKEVEKRWMDEHLGFRGTWQEGWVMYDGTVVVLYRKPGLSGDAYYTRKGNYGLNAQIGNTPSNLRIVDYSHGMTGSAHDASAFEHTTAAKHPEWFFDGDEFAWADSAYAVNSRTIPVHKKPASLDPSKALFDKVVAPQFFAY